MKNNGLLKNQSVKSNGLKKKGTKKDGLKLFEKNNDYDEEDLDEDEESDEEDEYDEDEYEDEEYEDEEYEDEDETEEYEDDDSDLHPLSDDTIELLESDYTVSVSDNPIKEISHLLDAYFEMKELEPEIEYEDQMREYSMSVIYDRTLDFEIPSDDLFELFVFVLTIEKYAQEHEDDMIFVGENPEDSDCTIIARIKEYLHDYPDVFCEIEIYDRIFEIDANLQNTPTYLRVLNMCYEDLIASGTNASLSALLNLYNEKRPLSDKYVGLVEIPSDNLDSFKRAFHLILDNPRQDGPMQKRFGELRQIIQTKYSSDEELSNWCQQSVQNTGFSHSDVKRFKEQQGAKEVNNTHIYKKEEAKQTANLYKVVKWTTLGVSIVFLLIIRIVGILLLVAWIVCYYTPVHDKISFLRENKDAANKKQ